jgi:hypothetical protein
LLFGLKGVAGVNLWLVKDLEDGVAGVLLFENMGVYDVNGLPKESAVLLRSLIMNFTASGRTTTSAEGQLTFTGFAGNYEVNVEGYQPFIVHVPEGARTNSTIALVPEKTQASTTTTNTNLLTATASQGTILSQVPTQFYLVILIGSMAVFAAGAVYLVRKRRRRNH